MRPYHRRRILVRTFQYHLLAFNLLYFLVLLLLLAAALFAPVILRMEGRNSSLNDQYAAAAQFLLLDAGLWPALGIVFILLTVHSIIISHRIAGPLIRFHWLFKALADGNLAVQATLRRGDYLAQEADDINGMIAAIRMKIQHAQEDCRRAHAAYEMARHESRHGSRESLCQRMDALGLELDRLRAALGKFLLVEEALAAAPHLQQKAVSHAATAQSTLLTEAPPARFPPCETERHGRGTIEESRE